MRFLLLLGFLICAPAAWAQHTLRAVVRDSATRQALPGVSGVVRGTTQGATTNGQGLLTIDNVAGPTAELVLSYLGYRATTVRVALPQTGGPLLVLLAPSANALDEVVVTSTRTNSRIEDLPTRVEVLGEEELQEENAIKPGNIASLLGDIAGTQIQPTQPTTGNADLRIQGLQGRYSQMLRDGLPLFGGYAGSFGILQVPPLDLRQIELIKGSSSTLYGGGAIAGLVNLVSKQPRLGHAEHSITLNQSTLRESNLNGFFSGRTQKAGYTLFAGGTRQQDVDVDGDGFTDVPRLRSLTVHPRLFFYPNRLGQLAVGYTGTVEDRQGGDQRVVREGSDALHQYFVTNKMQRHTADVVYTQDSVMGGGLTVKGTLSSFGRRVRTNTVDFRARQLSYFSELSYLHRLGGQHTVVAGLNFNGEQLRPQDGPSALPAGRYTYATVGGFVQDDWQPVAQLTVQGGLRLDHHNQYGTFLLPRLALLYRFSETVTSRLNGGLGYRVPVPFVNELDERDYPQIQPLIGLKAERSTGLNWDVNYQRSFSPTLTLNLNQSFFYTRLNAPLVLPDAAATPGMVPLAWYNAARPVVSQGFETYVRLRADETELYLGYVFTYARRRYDAVHPNVELAARHKLAAVATQEFSEHFALGIEASYTGQQYLSDGRRTPGYPILAGLARYTQGPLTLVLNGENLIDYRQTRREAVVLGSRLNPDFPQLWAPVEGRVINLSATVRF
ncbi:outer membrane receptor for ferrienterochelin and colicins [Hymenobacter daecheongensis DSM 21074]|uniref:Outer membrane receptor for ferrienterochelin and colicins n=1 Tax=Hymenobacter daecheongensis DSM 21074 TaxID=1121955 RepID=A0A1M6GQ85_9BACT|nr:TonB-dependent receptor [Hymenobacter daecheongensis]SHJ12058.1 outer membrane receptor for ferrienterochelin and colicins [Hymenobacter daecheongensis DSM 21074]